MTEALGAAAETPPAVHAPSAAPAGFWVRAVALLLDYGTVQAVRLSADAAARVLWGDVVDSSSVLAASVEAFRLLWAILYPVLFHWTWGQTFGKMALGIRVVSLSGEELPLGTACVRQLGFAVSVLSLGFGFVIAGLRSDKRALHDLLAGTRVERIPRAAPPRDAEAGQGVPTVRGAP